MRWDYDENFRDEFSKGVHRDIVIVPHATFVDKVPGGPPKITNKVPEFEWRTDLVGFPDGVWAPKRNSSGWVRDEVSWVITNEDLIKEKFKYSYSINSDDNLSFSACNAAMVQFTIRNKKVYEEEEDPTTGEGNGIFSWNPVVPNLQYLEFTKKGPEGSTERKITGLLEGNAVIKVYTYINGDSSTMICLGMFRVEEDKVVDNGYNRQITAYDFMASFRDMDIFYWYKHLFTGINKLDNDYEDYTKAKDEEDTTKPDDYDSADNWVREPSSKLYKDRGGRWTIGDALKDLINNLAAYDPVVYVPDLDENGKQKTDPETGKKLYKLQVGMTVDNPSNYGRDYDEGNCYCGLGMPIAIDPDILDISKKRDIPDEPGDKKYECYGYMKILEMEFMQDPKIMSSESLSMGKFLEDIGMLAGRYPFIRSDKFEDDPDKNDYIDPTTIRPDPDNLHPSKYINYERCYLSFKPLPSAENDKTSDGANKIPPDQIFSNREIAKGFQHDYYEVEDIAIIEIPLDDKNKIEYKRLNEAQRSTLKNGGNLQTFSMPNNMFASYLVKKSDKEGVKENLDTYKKLRKMLFGKEADGSNMSTSALFYEGYKNIKNRRYTPYQLTTYADPVRDVGDRILINFEDKITGEKVNFYSYILEREISGIQKMMDTYTAKGDMSSPTFSNYQSGNKYSSGSSYSAQSSGYNPSGGGEGTEDETAVTGISPEDLIEYWRNIGIRLLDEPTDCEANFVAVGKTKQVTSQLYNISGGTTSDIKDGDTTNPIIVIGENSEEEVTAAEGDYVYWYNDYQYDDPVVPSTVDAPLYIYLSNTWKYVGMDIGYGTNFYNCSDGDPVIALEEGEFTDGATCGVIKMSPGTAGSIHKHQLDDTAYYEYDTKTGGEVITEEITLEAQYGDTVVVFLNDTNQKFVYQYPGMWIDLSQHNYPKLDEPITIKTKPYVSLKWTDPPDIETWEPRPCAWEGTTIVRKEDSPPLHRWDGTRVTYNKTRDKHKTKAYKDKKIKTGKNYYYGFFPYYTYETLSGHDIRYYRFTKTIMVNTGTISDGPTIISVTAGEHSAIVAYMVPDPKVGTITSVKLYVKLGDNPACDETDDVVVDLTSETTGSYTVENLQDDIYYFCVQTTIDDDEDNTESSNVEMCDVGNGINKWDGNEIDIIWSGDSNKLTAQISNNTILFKMYTGDTNIYSFTSPIGTDKVDVGKINAGFIVDETNQLAKPSFYYNAGSGSYMYNQEQPTSSQMGDIYTWLGGTEPTPSPVIPDQYKSYINTINGSGFHWKNWTIRNDSGYTPLVPTTIPNMSWVKSGNYVIIRQSYPSPWITVNINGSDENGWILTYSGYSVSANTTCNINDTVRISYYVEADPSYPSQILATSIYNYYYSYNYYSDDYFANNLGTANTLTNALSNLATYFRNITIYVNGENWSNPN